MPDSLLKILKNAESSSSTGIMQFVDGTRLHVQVVEVGEGHDPLVWIRDSSYNVRAPNFSMIAAWFQDG